MLCIVWWDFFGVLLLSCGLSVMTDAICFCWLIRPMCSCCHFKPLRFFNHRPKGHTEQRLGFILIHTKLQLVSQSGKVSDKQHGRLLSGSYAQTLLILSICYGLCILFAYYTQIYSVHTAEWSIPIFNAGDISNVTVHHDGETPFFTQQNHYKTSEKEASHPEEPR